MKISIFTEWHKTTGRGHLTRCISLAESFIEKGFEPLIFIDCDENIETNIKSYIFNVKWLSHKSLFENKAKDSHIIIIDSYLAPIFYYKKVTELCDVPVFFDDDFRLNYPKGIIINGSIGIDSNLYLEKGYKNNVLAGTNYQVLQKEFHLNNKKEISLTVNNVLITLGGADYSELINNVIKILQHLNKNIVLHVVISKNIKKVIQNNNIKYYSDIDANKMHSLMSLCDFAITGAGQTIYELLITGTPFLALLVTDNQKYNATGLKNFKLATVIENFNLNTTFTNEIKTLFSFNKRNELYYKYQTVIDSKGASRIISEIFKEGLNNWFNLRKASAKDMLKVLELNNNLEVRNNSFHQKEIILEEHKIWFKNAINNPNIYFLVVEIAGIFAGQVRYNIEQNECVVGISISPKFRGISLGEKILKESAQKFKQKFSTINKITAYIKNENIASIKIFEKAGYNMLLENDIKNFNARKYILNL
ncbi:MAG: hypothetical protein A2X08_08455 [Bacteroidetes bacterium GWA2_32_17]|nr:MAG: hypothetical protein A2X08_08455 [Bacteroidetes bacterium GWA2_32_17]